MRKWIVMVWVWCITGVFLQAGYINAAQSKKLSHEVSHMPKLDMLSEEQRVFLSEKKEIRYCIDPDWMPLEAVEEGAAVGMVGSLVEIFSERIGVPFHLVETSSWRETLSYLKSGKCEIVPMLNPVQLYSQEYLVTTPYIHMPVVIATNISIPFIPDVAKLKGKRIGIAKGYIYEALIRHNYPDIELIEYSGIKEGLYAVEKGEVFGFIDNLYVLGYQIQKYFTSRLKISGQLTQKLHLSIAVEKHLPTLHSIMQHTAESIDQPTMEKLLAQWLSVTYTEKTDDTLLWKVLSVITVFGVLLFYRQYMLYQYNRQLQEEVTRKIDELRQKDELLIRKLRMAAMGEMLSMIAHQWRQPLSAISNTLLSIDVRLKMGKYDMNDPVDRKHFLDFLGQKHDLVMQYITYLSHTIDDFRHFFKPDKKKEVIAITQPVERALKLLESIFAEKGIIIQKEYGTNQEIDMVSNEVMQVILNILKNSEHNFQEKCFPSPLIKISTLEENERVVLKLCDNGGGIPQEHIASIFDPYYSTKDEINGTGLGLYMSKIMIEEHHNGELGAYNTEDGVCFVLSFKKRAKVK
jgi:signal transduction histidine kinase